MRLVPALWSGGRSLGQDRPAMDAQAPSDIQADALCLVLRYLDRFGRDPALKDYRESPGRETVQPGCNPPRDDERSGWISWESANVRERGTEETAFGLDWQPVPTPSRATTVRYVRIHFMSGAFDKGTAQSIRCGTMLQGGCSRKSETGSGRERGDSWAGARRSVGAWIRRMLVGWVFWVGAGVGMGADAGGGSGTGAKPFVWGVDAGVREAFDSNVYLQSQTDLANQASWQTALLGHVSGAWSSTPWNLRLGYFPEATYYPGESSEDFVSHRVLADAGFKGETTSVELAGSGVLIDGDSEGIIWTGPGGAPVTGGPAVRDRRDAAVYRGSLRIIQHQGSWVVRPHATVYHHDFRTVQKATPGYQNYVDRKEFTVGADVGRSVTAGSLAWLGYRYGEQDEALLLGYPEEYDNRFHRFLGGIEGTFRPWLKATVAVGPEVRRYGDAVPASFGDHEVVNFFADASITVIPSPSDSVVLSAKNFQQPGFSGRSAYDDLTLDVAWRHRVSANWSVGVGGRAYSTDFLAPVVRNDWVLSVNGFVHYDWNRHWSSEASYAFEDGETKDPGASGREYQRHWVALGVKVVFL